MVEEVVALRLQVKQRHPQGAVMVEQDKHHQYLVHQ